MTAPALNAAKQILKHREQHSEKLLNTVEEYAAIIEKHYADQQGVFEDLIDAGVRLDDFEKLGYCTTNETGLSPRKQWQQALTNAQKFIKS